MLEAFDSVRRDIDANVSRPGHVHHPRLRHDRLRRRPQRPRPATANRSSPRTAISGVEQFLTARRLVEAGVGCVTLSIGGWDTHGQNFQTLRRQLPQVDRGLAEPRSATCTTAACDNDVVIVMWGEFGRTPRINSNAGRDHWSPVMSALVAGGGLRMGQAIGASTARGERPQDRRVHRAAGARHAVPRRWASTRPDVPQRQRPADVHPRRPRTGPRADLTPLAARNDCRRRSQRRKVGCAPIRARVDIRPAASRHASTPTPLSGMLFPCTSTISAYRMIRSSPGCSLPSACPCRPLAPTIRTKKTPTPDAIKLPAPPRSRQLQMLIPQRIKLIGADDAAPARRHRRPRRRRPPGPDRRRQVRSRRRQGRPRHQRRPRHAARQRHDHDHRPLRRQDGHDRRQDRSRWTSTCRSTSPTTSCRSSPSSAATAAAATASRAARTASPCRCSASSPNSTTRPSSRKTAAAASSPRRPDNSLLLLKAAGVMAHAGGKRMEVGSDEYKLVRRWIASGTPFGNEQGPDRHQDHRLPRAAHHRPQQPPAVRRLRSLLRRHASST